MIVIDVKWSRRQNGLLEDIATRNTCVHAEDVTRRSSVDEIGERYGEISIHPSMFISDNYRLNRAIVVKLYHTYT